MPDDPFERINAYRTLAAVPTMVEEDAGMSAGAQAHAVYMATIHELVHYEDSGLHPEVYTDEGSAAAPLSNLWYGSGTGIWTPADAVDAWMESPFHRLWILYPQTKFMGFGFYESPFDRGSSTAAALQVFGGWDESIEFYWPLKYPADGQEDIPPTRYGVSLQFEARAANPVFSFVSWVDQDGQEVPHKRFDPETSVYMRDSGNAIFLYPNSNLARGMVYTVHIQGTHEGRPFDVEWHFTTAG